MKSTSNLRIEVEYNSSAKLNVILHFSAAHYLAFDITIFLFSFSSARNQKESSHAAGIGLSETDGHLEIPEY